MSSSSSTKTTPYVGYNKMMRLETSVKKTLAILGSTVDLRYANYYKIERLALILSIKKTLRARVESTKINKINSNPNFIMHVYKVLLLISDGMPLIISRLDKGRFFSMLLLDGSVAGLRLLKKQNVQAMLRDAFPHCFDYTDAELNHYYRLARIINYAPAAAGAAPAAGSATAAPVSQNDALILDSIPTLMATAALMFIAGAAYCWLVIVGLKQL